MFPPQGLPWLAAGTIRYHEPVQAADISSHTGPLPSASCTDTELQPKEVEEINHQIQSRAAFTAFSARCRSYFDLIIFKCLIVFSYSL